MLEIERVQIALKNMDTEPLSGHLRLGGESPDGRKIDVNSLYFTMDGRPFIPVMGEFHYSRYPDGLWEDEILKMKAGGITVISSYVFWIHHEEIEGEFDWTGRRNLRKFLELCARHGLYSFVRIGPWCHGEVRNGGFPDWLLDRCRLRCDDPVYLTLVRRLFREISAQVGGLLFKDGGNIIGVQLENELISGPEHYMTLKGMAKELGIDAPIFTATGWAGEKPGASWIPRDEMIPVFAGYPDGAWDQRLTDISPGWLYFFHKVRNDFFTGNDIFGSKHEENVCDCTDIRRYPYAACELGAGMNNSYHRRPIITADDVCAMVLVKLGSGVNLPGYYVYHGGSNPEGELTTLQESKETGYPNDYTVISYDYQAPVGEFGQIRKSYGKLNCINMFLKDFGYELAPMQPAFPKIPPCGSEDVEMLRYAARARSGSGFIFMNNYQRHAILKDHENVMISLELDKEILVLPRKGLTIKNGSYFILPFNMNMEGVLLKYGTAQLLCRISHNGEPYYFFLEPDGVSSEYAFDAGTISGIDAETASLEKAGGLIHVYGLTVGTGCVLNITAAGGRRIKIVTLTKVQAENCRKVESGGTERLFMTGLGLIADSDCIRFFGSNREQAFSVFPRPMCVCTSKGEPVPGKKDGIFTRYMAEITEKKFEMTYETSIVQIPDSIYSKYLFTGNERDAVLQCTVRIDAEGIEELNELHLRVDYIGDVAQAYIGGMLITDEYYKGTMWEIGLKRFAGELAQSPLILLISPLYKGAPIYIENWPDFTGKDKIADILRMELVPEYKKDLWIVY